MHVFSLWVLFLPAACQPALSISIFAKSKNRSITAAPHVAALHAAQMCHFDICFFLLLRAFLLWFCAVFYAFQCLLWSAFALQLRLSTSMSFVLESRCIKTASESTTASSVSVSSRATTGCNHASDFGDWVSPFFPPLFFGSWVVKVIKFSRKKVVSRLKNTDNHSHNACLQDYMFQQHMGDRTSGKCLSERSCLLAFHKGSAST